MYVDMYSLQVYVFSAMMILVGDMQLPVGQIWPCNNDNLGTNN